MEENLSIAKNILKKYKQEHLLTFYDELNKEEQEYLLNQICDTDFNQILNLYEASKYDEIIHYHDIKPLPYDVKGNLSEEEKKIYNEIGSNVLKNHKFAIVTLAGGQGTRLGYKGPKGTFELDLKPKKSLFELLCDRLKYANQLYQTIIPWYIMTSIYNDSDTKKYFEEKNYFGYPKEYIYFFKQSELPLIDVNGNLMLEEPFKIREASNGNGDVFASLKKSNMLQDLKSRHIEWVFFSGIDNVLLDPADTTFIGITIHNRCLAASKTLFKENPSDKDWVFAKKRGVPSILDCNYLSEEMKNSKDEQGNFLYRDVNMLAHLFNITSLEILCDTNLPYHRAFKKNTFVNEEGMKQVPEAPNSFKFETFIFDAFSFFDKVQLLRVEKDKEFAPIKAFNGPYNPEVAKELYLKNVNNK